jgi:hypothetical protein
MRRAAAGNTASLRPAEKAVQEHLFTSLAHGRGSRHVFLSRLSIRQVISRSMRSPSVPAFFLHRSALRKSHRTTSSPMTPRPRWERGGSYYTPRRPTGAPSEAVDLVVEPGGRARTHALVSLDPFEAQLEALGLHYRTKAHLKTTYRRI